MKLYYYLQSCHRRSSELYTSSVTSDSWRTSVFSQWNYLCDVSRCPRAKIRSNGVRLPTFNTRCPWWNSLYGNDSTTVPVPDIIQEIISNDAVPEFQGLIKVNQYYSKHRLRDIKGIAAKMTCKTEQMSEILVWKQVWAMVESLF